MYIQASLCHSSLTLDRLCRKVLFIVVIFTRPIAFRVQLAVYVLVPLRRVH